MLELHIKLKEILAEGRFNLKKFVTDSTRLNDHMGLTEQVLLFCGLVIKTLRETKVA